MVQCFESLLPPVGMFHSDPARTDGITGFGWTLQYFTTLRRGEGQRTGEGMGFDTIWGGRDWDHTCSVPNYFDIAPGHIAFQEIRWNVRVTPWISQPLPTAAGHLLAGFAMIIFKSSPERCPCAM